LPERTIAGGTIAHDPDGHPAALFRRIPGVHLQGMADGALRALGTAFAELDEALAATPDVGVAPPSFDGDLARIHAQVPDLGSLPELSRATRDEVVAATGDAEALYTSLPRQIAHGDFAFGNALFLDGRVTAILDFEFAGLDLRAMDLAAACYILTARYHGSASWRPFVGAYVARLPLTDAEGAGLPALITVHAAVDLVHWLGRSRAGPAMAARVAEVAARLHEVRSWRSHHGAELVEIVRRGSA
jgi:homoserine kinase type II